VSCDTYREALIELGRAGRDVAESAAGQSARDHAAGCPACAALLREQQALSRGLATLAAEDAHLSAPPSIEASLLGACRRLATERRRPGRRGAGLRIALAAAAVALALAAAWLAVPTRPVVPGPAVRHAAATPGRAVLEDAPAEFVPLVYGDALEGADALQLMRVRVPRQALASLGWPAAAAEEGADSLEAQVVVGQDGVARAIRFVGH
jgi:hypothetical protein